MILGVGLVVAGIVMWNMVKGPPDELAYQGSPEVLPSPA
jgi:hypothetical protein